MHCHVPKRLVIVVFTVIALSLSGCGPRQFSVSGKVTYNGNVLDKPDGIIVFVGPNGEQADAEINRDGTYTVPKVQAGKNRIVVYYKNPQFKGNEKPPKPGPGEKLKTPPPAYITPESYVSPDTSGLSVEVENVMVHDVNMTGPSIP